MKILIAAATHKEIETLLNNLENKAVKNNFISQYDYGQHEIDVLITGVGMYNMAFNMGRALQKEQYDVAYNFGIAGAYNTALQIGEIVNVRDDMFAEIATKFDNKLIPFDGANNSIIVEPYFISNPNEALFPLNSVYLVSAITVNTVNTDNSLINSLEIDHEIDIESMEGAAFMASCENFNLPYFQVRSISNYIKPKTEAQWDIETALFELNDIALEILKNLA